MSQEIFLIVKIIPKAHQNSIASWENGVLKIRLKAIPEKGKANEALIHFLAHFLEIPQKNIVLIQGKSSRQKKLKILGKTPAELESLFQPYS